MANARAASRIDVDRTIGTILVPLIRREIDDLLALVADMPRPSASAPPRFVVSIDGRFDDNDRARIVAAFAASAVRDARLSFLACDIEAEQSFYLRKRPATFDVARHPYGWKSGPNSQFFTSLRRLIEEGPHVGSVLLMETDAFPLVPFWADRVNSELRGAGAFLVAGACYRGLSELPRDIEAHINGNAVYALSDARFPAMLEAWERVLLDVIPSAPWQAYDVTPEWARHNRTRASSAAVTPFYDRLAAAAERDTVHLRSIANFAGQYEASASLGDTYPGFRSLRDVEIVHVKVPAWLRRRLEAKKRIEIALDAGAGGAADATVGGELRDHHWQSPTVTELTAFRRAQASLGGSRHALYLGVPWATIIDRLLHRPERALEFAGLLRDAANRARGRTHVVTVCQHVHMLEFIHLFERAGVTDIFWSHATKEVDFVVRDGLIKLHPFPLYPVQHVDRPWHEGDRPHLFSFSGWRGSFYPSPARALIFDLLAGDRRGVIIGRDGWHYDRIVHDHQLKGDASDVPAAALTDEAAGRQFREILQDSIFCLCPAGSGPNSIRLWEAIGAGAIPVILSDNYAPPGDPALWQAAAVFCPETAAAVAALPDRLEALARDSATIARKRHALRQLWLLYGPDTFIYDIQKFWLEVAVDDHHRHDPLPLDWSELSDLADRVGGGDARNDERALFLSACASRSILDPAAFDAALEQYPAIAPAHGSAASADSTSPFLRTFERASALPRPRKGPDASAARKKRLKACLVGRHAMRTPLAYEPYRRLFADALELTDDMVRADLVVVGFSIDIRENAAQMRHAVARNPDLQLVVLSEEPLWDTVWSGPFWKKSVSFEHEGNLLRYHNINHVNSSIYDFCHVPYFITTNDAFFLRYANLFRRNASQPARAWLEQWSGSAWHAAFYAEKRDRSIYDVRHPELDIEGLCGFRTRVAESLAGDRVARVGHGWSDSVRRQELPDWHLDKLAALDRRAFIVSGIENTHQRHYVTEKIFDAFAVGAVPVYFASADHRIHDVVSADAYLNVFGLTSAAAAEHIAAFAPDLAFAERYREAQHRLAALFSRPATLLEERQRVVREVVRALETLCS